MNSDERLNEISNKLDKIRQEYLKGKYENLCYILWGFTLAMLGLTVTNPLVVNILVTIVFLIMGWVMWFRFIRVKVK